MTMKVARKVSIVAAWALLAVGQPASAALLTATVSGIVLAQAASGGAFDIGVFGAGFRSLVGEAFAATHVFDLDAAPLRYTSAGTSPP